jgi:hypothetical protein
VRDPRAYLVRIVTRLALDRLRTLGRRREDYVGDWLPDPLLTTADVAEDVELAENLSIAMLTVLETLRPAERAVFVLREVFDFPYDDIGVAIDKSAAAVRQIAYRARQHVAARRPRMRISKTEQAEVVERLIGALSAGDVQGMMDVLAPDVVLITDGGGVARATLRPLEGLKKVAAFLAGLPQLAPNAQIRTVWLNGTLGARVDQDGELDTVATFAVDNGQITRIYVIRNPQKLGWVNTSTPLGRTSLTST